MYLYCKNCGWEQDDFWDKNYNPLKSLIDWQETLLDFDKLDRKKRYEVDRDSVIYRTPREMVTLYCEEAIRKIKNQVFLTFDDVKNEEYKCPNCFNHLDID